MPQASKQNIIRAIRVLVQRQMTVSTRQVTSLIGGSRRDITRLMRELRAEKGRRTWAQWVDDSGLQSASAEPAMMMTRKQWRRFIEGRGSLATVRQKLNRQAAIAPPVVEAKPEPPPSGRRLHTPPSTTPLLVCSICGKLYRPAYPQQPPCCLDSSCGREYHRRRREGLL